MEASVPILNGRSKYHTDVTAQVYEHIAICQKLFSTIGSMCKYLLLLSYVFQFQPIKD